MTEQKQNTVAEEEKRVRPDPLAFDLKKPIQAHGDEVKSIKFREPTAADIEKFGNPVFLDFVNDSVKVSIDEKKMMQMMAGLAEVPPSSIRMMNPADWSTCAYGLASFFMPDLSRLF